MATMNDVQQSTEPQSPTTLVISYLKSKGVPLTSVNVRDALHQNALNGGTLIPGLINQDPGEEDGTARRAATGGPGVGKGGGSSVARQVESGTTRVGDASPDQRGRDSGGGGGAADTSPDQRGRGGGDGEKPTSAAPDAAGGATPPVDRRPLDAALTKAVAPAGSTPDEFTEQQSQQLGLGSSIDPTVAATAGMVLPSLANLIFGNKGAQVPGTLAIGPRGLGAEAAGPPEAPFGPPQAPFGPPQAPHGPPEAPTVALPPGSTNAGVPAPEVPFNSPSPRVAPTDPLAPRATPPGLTLTDPLAPGNAPQVPFTPRPGGAPRVAPPPASGLEAARRAAIDAARAARMFRR